MKYLILLCTLVSFSTASAHQSKTVVEAIGIVKESNIVIESSEILISGGYTTIGAVVLLNEVGGLGAASKTLVVRWGGRTVFLGMAGLVAGVFYEVLKPTPAHAGELTDYYMTPEGFAVFLKLSPEEMLFYSELDKELGDLVISLADLASSTQ